MLPLPRAPGAHKAGSTGPRGPAPHTLGHALVSCPPQCSVPGVQASSHGGGFNRPCQLLGRGGQALDTVRRKSRCPGPARPMMSAHTAHPPWPLHTPGVTVDLDDVPGLVGGLVVQARAVLLGHAASAPIGQQPHWADAARHAVGAELWTSGCPSAVPLATAQGHREVGMLPTQAPGSTALSFWPTHTVHVQGVAASHTLGPLRVHGGIAAIQEHHGGHTPCRDSHAGRVSWPAAALPSVVGGARVPKGKGPGEAVPVLCSVAPRQLSLPLTHELREMRGGSLGHCPHPPTLPRLRPGPGPCREGRGRHLLRGCDEDPQPQPKGTE